MQNDPLYNRIMKQMPDTEAIESELTMLSGEVTSLESKQAKIFTFHITIDPDDDNALSCAEFSLLTPSQFLELNPDIITTRIEVLQGEDNSPYQLWVNTFAKYPLLELDTNYFDLEFGVDYIGYIVIQSTESNTWNIFYD